MTLKDYISHSVIFLFERSYYKSLSSFLDGVLFLYRLAEKGARILSIIFKLQTDLDEIPTESEILTKLQK